MTQPDASRAPESAGERKRMNYLASALAVLVSLVSLGVAISSNRTQERLLAASVWPMLEYGTGNRGEDGSDLIILTVGNSGVGPARLRTFQVRYEREAVPNATALLRRCCELAKGKLTTITSSTRARVLKAGDDVQFLRLPRADNDQGLWERFNRERFKVEVSACYCSVLDDCWQLDSARIEPTPVASCPVVPDADQWHG